MQLQQEKQTAKLNLLRKCGLLAHASPAFLKNCWSKKFFVRLRLGIGNTLLLEKPLESGSARLGHIPSLPRESQLPLKPCSVITSFRLWRQLWFFRFSLRFLFSFIVQFLFASQMWAARPRLASIFEKLLEQKTFYLPVAWNWKLFIFSSVFRQLFTKSRICAKMKTIEKNRRQKTWRF